MAKVNAAAAKAKLRLRLVLLIMGVSSRLGIKNLPSANLTDLLTRESRLQTYSYVFIYRHCVYKIGRH